jgi:hypothetical protein
MSETEPRRDDEALREAQEGKGYGADPGEREEGLDREDDEPADADADEPD